MKTANMLSKEGLNVVGIPKTIDNDVWGTDVTFGFDFGYSAGTYAEVRLGGITGSGRASLETGTIPPELEEDLRDINFGGARLLARADRLPVQPGPLRVPGDPLLAPPGQWPVPGDLFPQRSRRFPQPCRFHRATSIPKTPHPR